MGRSLTIVLGVVAQKLFHHVNVFESLSEDYSNVD